MRFIFIVQGEGRGHMTQAMAMYEILSRNGHEIVEVWLGRSHRREVPAFFTETVKSPIEPFQSPNFVTDKNNKSIDIPATLFGNMKRCSVFFGEMSRLDKRLKELQPDMVINFYDLLAGLYNVFYKSPVPFVGIAHQFMVQHPAMKYPEGRGMEKMFLKINTFLSGYRSVKKLTLSFYPLAPNVSSNVYPVPPLLRSEVKPLEVTEGDYLLAYSVNAGYSEDVKRWHVSNRDIKVHYFWDGAQESEEVAHHPNLIFHKLNGHKFLKMMAGCKGFVTSAGFESVCEALYLGKPTMMIPTEGQYEQSCNAVDGVYAGAGISSSTFDLSKLVEYLPKHNPKTTLFREWADGAEEYLIEHLTGEKINDKATLFV
jgi:uncharacterized protein (TIGR00661 family)